METEHDLMEAPAEAICSSLGKRKAETQGLEESGGSQRSGEGVIEKGGSSSAVSGSSPPAEAMAEHSEDDDSRELEWGYDSFDGHKYTTPRNYLYSDDESYQKSCRYTRQYLEYKGFYIDRENIPDGQIGGVVPCSDKSLDEVLKSGKTMGQHMGDLAKEAIQMYNQINGTDVTFDKVVRMNRSLFKIYLTILAKGDPSEPPVEYQVKVRRRWVMEGYQPVFCRPAPSRSKGMH